MIEILSHSKPFYDLPEPVAEDKPGYFKLEAPGLTGKEAKITYWVQLPPEYDPYKHYPAIVTLNGEGRHRRKTNHLVGGRLERRPTVRPGRRATGISSSRPSGPRSIKRITAIRPGNMPPC